MDEAVAVLAAAGVLFVAVLGVDWAGDRGGGAGRVESAARDSAFALLEDEVSSGDAAAEGVAEGDLRGRVALAETCVAFSIPRPDRWGAGADRVAAVQVDGCELSSGWVFDDLVDVRAVCGRTEPGWGIAGSGVPAEPLVWCETNAR